MTNRIRCKCGEVHELSDIKKEEIDLIKTVYGQAVKMICGLSDELGNKVDEFYQEVRHQFIGQDIENDEVAEHVARLVVLERLGHTIDAAAAMTKLRLLIDVLPKGDTVH